MWRHTVYGGIYALDRVREDPRLLKVGGELSAIGAFSAFICRVSGRRVRGRLATPLAAFVVVFAVAAGVSVVSGLLGRFVLVQRLGRTRRSARAAHAVTGLLLIVAGVDHLRQTRWVVAVYDWLIH